LGAGALALAVDPLASGVTASAGIGALIASVSGAVL